ncbi:MAG: hypothetical protein JW863_20335 [Chitinispirillaceae bacterium]|nr:hypothetical protein [Chitinispirillaceae bacterium]
MRHVFLLISATIVLGVLIGCSGFDSTQVLVHPDTLTTSGTVDIALVNLYTYIDTAGSVISKDITRDSLHLLVGIPESWEVSEVKTAVVDDMNTSDLLALQTSLVDEQMAAGLLAQYLASAVDATADDGVASALAGTPVDAHGASGDGTLSVAVEDLEQAKGFSVPVNITIEKGSKADTTLALDSMIAFVQGTGMVPDSVMQSVTELLNYPLLKKPDSVGIVMVPVIVFLKITAGSTEGNDTLYYFTKTGAMDQEPSSIISTIALLSPDMAPMLTGIESGDMTFMPVTVVDAAGTVSERGRVSFSGTRVTADRTTGTVRINPGTVIPENALVSVYSLQGNLITTLGPCQVAGSSILWHGTDRSGRRVGEGTYLFRIADKTSSQVFTAALMR